MISSPAQLSVLTGQAFACLKISGRANFTASIDFKAALHRLFDQGYRYFVLDLSDCAMMDSTFLGALAGCGLKMDPAKADQGGGLIELLNPNARILDSLENLGILHLFRLSTGQPTPAGDGRPQQEITPAQPEKVEVTRACLEAHQTLMAINPENASRFRDVAKFLAEDLQKLEQENNRPK